MNKTAVNGKKKMHQSFGDRMISVACYAVFSICAVLCIYPFYYIFINTISANDLSSKGAILFWPQGVHLKNYASALQIDGLFQAAKISVLLSLSWRSIEMKFLICLIQTPGPLWASCHRRTRIHRLDTS